MVYSSLFQVSSGYIKCIRQVQIVGYALIHETKCNLLAIACWTVATWCIIVTTRVSPTGFDDFFRTKACLELAMLITDSYAEDITVSIQGDGD